jgi:hypothetical protein
MPRSALRTNALALGIAVCLVSGLAACGSDADENQARSAAEGLYAAVSRHDGDAACARLSSAAAQALEQQEKEACAKAVTGLDLQGSHAARVRVFETSAAVTFAGGELAFLDRTGEGWRVSAAGCKPRGREPADCELEA